MGETDLDTNPADRERELMKVFYGCSTTAFEELSELWLPRLQAFYRKMGFGWEDAEDLSLDVMVRLYATKELRTFDTNLPLQPFLFTIARRLAIAYWRKRAKCVITVPILEAEHVHSTSSESYTDLCIDVMDCVWELPETEQTYVVLCERYGLGELSHNEIAVVLGKWPAQVTQISKQARGALKACLTKKGY